MGARRLQLFSPDLGGWFGVKPMAAWKCASLEKHAGSGVCEIEVCAEWDWIWNILQLTAAEAGFQTNAIIIDAVDEQWEVDVQRTTGGQLREPMQHGNPGRGEQCRAEPGWLREGGREDHYIKCWHNEVKLNSKVSIEIHKLTSL